MQVRELVETSEYEILGWTDDEQVVLKDKDDISKYRYKLYQKNNSFSGHVIVIDGVGYEFVTSIPLDELGKYKLIRRI